MFLFWIDAKEKSTFSTLFLLHLHIFSPEQALCYFISEFFNHWYWWLIPEATSESHTFIFGSLPCLSQWHHFSSSAVPKLAKAFHSLQQIILLSVRHIFDQTLKKIFFGNRKIGLICCLVVWLRLLQNHIRVSKFNCLLIFLLVLMISSISVVLGWFRTLSIPLPSLHYKFVERP